MDTPFAIGSDNWPGISKLIEECGEVLQVCGKIIATGGGVDHWDGTKLHKRLEEELGDLKAAIAFVTQRCQLDQLAIETRAAEKLHTFNDWHQKQTTTFTRE